MNEELKRPKSKADKLADKIIKRNLANQVVSKPVINEKTDFEKLSKLQKPKIDSLIKEYSKNKSSSTLKTLQNLISDYLISLKEVSSNAQNMFKLFNDSENPVVIEKVTGALKKALKNEKEEKDRLSEFMKTNQSAITITPGLPSHIQEAFEMSINALKQQTHPQKPRPQLKRKPSVSGDMEIDSFQYSINDFTYVQIVKNKFYKGISAEIVEFNPMKETLKVRLTTTGNLINLPKSEYAFISANGLLVPPEVVNHDFKSKKTRPVSRRSFVSGFVSGTQSPFYQPSSPGSRSSGSQSPFYQPSSPGSSRRSSGIPEQASFEQQLNMALANISSEERKIRNIIKEINDLIDIDLPFDKVNEIISNFNTYKDLRGSDFKNLQELKLFVAILMYHTFRDSVYTGREFPSCGSLPSWESPDYFACILDQTGYINRQSGKSVPQIIREAYSTFLSELKGKRKRRESVTELTGKFKKLNTQNSIENLIEEMSSMTVDTKKIVKDPKTTKPELVKIAQQLKMKNISKLKKDELVKAILKVL